MDTYGYVHGNPLLSIDPTGEYDLHQQDWTPC
ncbi:hypothetical protein [Vibrio parahaemolyticus]